MMVEQVTAGVATERSRDVGHEEKKPTTVAMVWKTAHWEAGTTMTVTVTATVTATAKKNGNGNGQAVLKGRQPRQPPSCTRTGVGSGKAAEAASVSKSPSQSSGGAQKGGGHPQGDERWERRIICSWVADGLSAPCLQCPCGRGPATRGGPTVRWATRTTSDRQAVRRHRRESEASGWPRARPGRLPVTALQCMSRVRAR